jgi:hypothetical protein
MTAVTPRLLIVFLVVAMGLLGDASTALARSQSCLTAPAHHEIARNSIARVYESRAYNAIACLLRTGRAVGLARDIREQELRRPVALAGRWFAFERDDILGEGLDSSLDFTVRIVNLNTGRVRYAGCTEPLACYVQLHLRAVVAKPNGSAAWSIATDYIRPSPSCKITMNAGCGAAIYRLERGDAHPRLVARSFRLRARSLKLDGSRLTWIQAGRRRSAPLR